MTRTTANTTTDTTTSTINRTRLYIARHGQVANHHEYRYNGHNDVDITDLGTEQMNKLAEFIDEPITAVYSSDLIRSRKGGSIIADSQSIPHHPKKELRELSLGRWEGLTREEAHAKYPEEAHIQFMDLATERLKGGESFIDLQKRIIPEVENIIEFHRGETVFLLLHGLVNRVILCHVMGLDIKNFFTIEQDFGCVNIIDYFHDGVAVVKMTNGGPNSNITKTLLY